MTTPTHGGPRPVTRPDDGRRSNGGHSGTGPKPKSFTLKLGDVFFMSLTTATGQAVLPGVVGRVDNITRTHLTLTDIHNGDRYEIIR